MAVKGTVVRGTAGALGAQVLVSGAWGQTTLDATLLNVDSGTVYIGGSDAAPTVTGFGLVPGASVSLTLFPSDAIYGTVATSGTVQVQVLLRGIP